MVAYLQEGWFAQSGPRRLRAEVVDGALDSAGYLHRADLAPEAVLRLALQVRALTALVDPVHRHVNLDHAPQAQPSRSLAASAKNVLAQRLAEATDACVELQSFVLDCFEHVGDLDALRGLFLHLLHVAHVMRLLARTRDSAAVHAFVAGHDQLHFNAQGRLTRQSST